ncbi:hypothetical protein [Pelagibacterium luteolum]|uniref:Uncharacterized protein n=1 Tax=Pelagibacterium luteolum TaxID=440168 RepID=A0A1G8A7T3_9HYPH|nr:hypothetical protein [Pelagibacterium luteolum]SDH17002.1 hypothetical protein SAMN04487974_1277 [Pelagibacterium luteolum]
MQGNKTHEQFLRTLERKPTVPRDGEVEKHPERSRGRGPRDRQARQSEFPVSQQGINEEDRQYNNKKSD